MIKKEKYDQFDYEYHMQKNWWEARYNKEKAEGSYDMYYSSFHVKLIGDDFDNRYLKKDPETIQFFLSDLIVNKLKLAYAEIPVKSTQDPLNILKTYDARWVYIQNKNIKLKFHLRIEVLEFSNFNYQHKFKIDITQIDMNAAKTIPNVIFYINVQKRLIGKNIHIEDLSTYTQYVDVNIIDAEDVRRTSRYTVLSIVSKYLYIAILNGKIPLLSRKFADVEITREYLEDEFTICCRWSKKLFPNEGEVITINKAIKRLNEMHKDKEVTINLETIANRLLYTAERLNLKEDYQIKILKQIIKE